ncbi:AraC family transcriptional regulator [Vibrio sp. vnigr-6D03]|uniref:helix-turn-helix domain-containing protein n=1 Tax=Vibrio sp. vnigr-6D03 TaxID=2058088 RepID=UPI000C3301EB|nr:helix-turn-helix domain-containing protein [Vibrio sp. vnigr-6D03]PKF78191.1 AraC family transcriptional regulator [Vibrio sp. vnigr-6D03]
MDFEIVKPKHKLADHVQGIWSVAMVKGKHQTTLKPLHSDGGSGVMFVLQGNVRLSDSEISHPIYLQQYSKTTQFIEFAEGTQLCGIRFHPGMMPTSLLTHSGDTLPQSQSPLLASLYSLLLEKTNQSSRLATLYRWCTENIDLNDAVMEKRALLINQAIHGKIGEQFQHNQRQIERNFHNWIGMSPKYFQRLRRVYSSVATLRENPEVSLSDFAYAQGFSDQAHMTREFKAFVLTTPGEMSSRLKRR